MSKTYIPKALRELVAAQGCYRCGYCRTQERVVGVAMDVEHIIPEALGFDPLRGPLPPADSPAPPSRAAAATVTRL